MVFTFSNFLTTRTESPSLLDGEPSSSPKRTDFLVSAIGLREGVLFWWVEIPWRFRNGSLRDFCLSEEGDFVGEEISS